jgi:small GTP-binding protein
MSEDETIKILIVGDLSTGKSALVNRFMSNVYTEEHFATVGIRYKSKFILREQQQYSLQIWDSSGNKNAIQFVKNYYQLVNGFLYVYDVGNYRSFQDLTYWLQLMNDDLPRVLVGCKNDSLKKEVPTELAAQFAKENHMEFVETSALEGTMVNEAFQLLICKIIETKFGRPISNSFNDMITLSSVSDRSSTLTQSHTENTSCCDYLNRYLFSSKK